LPVERPLFSGFSADFRSVSLSFGGGAAVSQPNFLKLTKEV
jgi:hypothetical protein